MPRWVCPDCGRQFGRVRQGHECAPAMGLEEYLATGPPFERPVVEAVLAGLADVGPIHVEPVSVGIFLKRSRTFSELRPLTRWMAVSFSIPRVKPSTRIARKVIPHGSLFHHVVNVTRPEEVDDQLLGWLSEAYLVSPE